MNKAAFRKAGLIALVALLSIGGTTTAYLTSRDSAVNSTSAGNVTTHTDEVFPDPVPTPVPNDPEYQKQVWVVNGTGEAPGFHCPCYVRAMISFSNNDIGQGVTLTGRNTSDWIYNSRDGYYYYTHVLNENEKTTPLFTGVKFHAAQMDNTYQDSLEEFRINIYHESIQASGFSDYLSAWDYYLSPRPASRGDAAGGSSL